MKRIIKISFIISILLIFVLCITAFAVTEDEVKSAVDTSSKESVSGNLLVWFLCAIAFLKVSQKIDSFMSSLGITVGKTGSSMMSEMVIAMKGVGAVSKIGAMFGKGGKMSGGTPAGSSAFTGLGGKFASSAASMATGGSGAGGFVGAIGKKMFNSSMAMMKMIIL